MMVFFSQGFDLLLKRVMGKVDMLYDFFSWKFSKFQKSTLYKSVLTNILFYLCYNRILDGVRWMLYVNYSISENARRDHAVEVS